MDAQFSFSNLLALASRLERHITIYDLEGTGFRGPGFGITEVAGFTVAPKGTEGYLFSALINPERTITPEAMRITGITQAMVADKELWSARYAALFKTLAAEHWVGGFNNKTFDNHAVRDMNERYGQPFDEFKYSFDIRNLHLNLSVAASKAGKLHEIAAMYGITARGDLHRASADVVMTVETFDAIIQTFGLDAVIARLLPKKKGAVDQLTAQAIAKYAKGKTVLTVTDVASAFGATERDAGYELGRAIDENLVDPAIFAAADAQHWLSEALVELDMTLLSQGKLKPLYERLKVSKPEAIPFDYIQLRAAMHSAGLHWSSRKPS